MLACEDWKKGNLEGLKMSEIQVEPPDPYTELVDLVTLLIWIVLTNSIEVCLDFKNWKLYFVSPELFVP